MGPAKEKDEGDKGGGGQARFRDGLLGSPYGVDKNVCVVWASEKLLEAYHSLPLDMPFRDAVTYLVAIQPTE